MVRNFTGMLMIFALWHAQVAHAGTPMAMQVDDVVAKDMAARHTPGASVAVIRDGKVVL